MNKWIGMGRLTKDPETRYSNGEKSIAITRFTLAVDRRGKRQEGQTADFISCVAFDKAGEFAEKYFHKGTKVLVTGRIQTGSYTNKNGDKVYTTEIVVEEQEFAESKAAASDVQEARQADIRAAQAKKAPEARQESFMTIPADLEDDALPFN
mgnify:CR=1 FL=1